MLEMFARAIIRFRLVIFVAILLVTAFFGYQLKNVGLRQSLDDIVPLDHPYVKLDKKMFDIFGGSNLVSIGVCVKEGDVFNLDTLGKIYRITDELRYLKGVVPYRIVSIASRKLRHVYTYRDPKAPAYSTVNNTGYITMVKDILRDKKPEDLEFYKAAVTGNPSVLGSVVSNDLKGTVILADFTGEENYKYVFDNIRRITKQEEDANTTFHLGGRPIMLGYVNLYLTRMIGMFGVALLVMIVLLFFSFGNIRGMALPLAAGIVTVIWTLGIMGTLRVRMDLMSLVVPFLILSIAISHSVQIIKRFYERVSVTGEKIVASEQALVGIIPPALTAIITDSLGFGSIMVFPFRVIRSLGATASLGILTVFVTTVIFIAVAMALLPTPSRKELAKQEKESRLEKALSFMARASFKPGTRVVVIVSALLLMGAGAVGMSKVVTGDTRAGSPFFWENSAYNQDDRILRENFTGTVPYYIFIDSKERFGIADPTLTHDIDRLQDILRKRPEVGYVTSYVDVVKSSNAAWHDMDKTYYTLPEDFDTASELLNDFFGGVEPGVTDAYFDLSMRYANIQVFLRNSKASSITGIIDETNRFVREEKQSTFEIVPAAGLAGLFASIIEVTDQKSIQNISQVSLGIFILCAILFRSFIGGLVILLPLAIGKLVTFGVMGFSKIGLFLHTIPAISPGMGIGVDYSIYVLDRLKDELKEHPDDHEKAYVTALSTSGKAVIFTGMSVACGVLVLLLSELRFQAIMGEVLAIVILCNMIGALVLLPSVVSIWKPRFLYGDMEVQRAVTKTEFRATSN